MFSLSKRMGMLGGKAKVDAKQKREGTKAHKREREIAQQLSAGRVRKDVN
jgi:hypothetical protein